MLPFETLLQLTSESVASLAALLRRLANNPWIKSVDLIATIPAGETSVTVEHGLGRTLNGAVVVGQDDPSHNVTVELPGPGADTFVVIHSDAPPSASFRVKLRIY